MGTRESPDLPSSGLPSAYGRCRPLMSKLGGNNGIWMLINTMFVKSLYLVVWLVVFSIFSPPIMADIRSATGKPLLDFYTVYGAIDSVKIINELCNTNFPAYKGQTDRAYNLWRSRHKEFIYKIEQYSHALVTKTSKGNEDAYRKQMIDILLIYERNKVAMHKTFSDFGGTAYSATCSSYPEYLESEKADIPNYYKEHIQVFEDYWRKQK